MLWYEIDTNARHNAEDINIDRGPQQTSDTENLWLNVIIKHSKFISLSFVCLFSTTEPAHETMVLIT